MKCRLTVKDVFDYINSVAPFDKQCEWDNSGLLVGNAENEVEKIGIVLDITPDAVSYAVKSGIDLIISHHPVIFKAVKSFLDGNPAYMMAKNGISAICAHTSLDYAKGGVNDVLAKTLGFENPVRLTEEGEAAIVRVAQIDETSADTLAKLVADKLSTGVRLADSGKKIKKIALCGGSGGDFIRDVAENCDAYITGDISHHEFLDALELGLTLIAAGHFETENPVVDALAENLKNKFDCEIEIIPQQSPVKYF